MSQLFSTAVHGVKWSAVSSIGIVLSQFTLGVVLARLLSPDDYGLVAMVLVLILYANLLVNFGLEAVMIQRQNIGQRELSGIFWVNCFLGFILMLSFLLMAPWISLFYGTDLNDIIFALAPIVWMHGFGISHRSVLQKKIHLRPIAIAEVSSVIISTLIAIIMAFRGFGVWSLVAQSILKAMIGNCLLIISSRWSPTLEFSWKGMRSLFGFSSVILTNNLAEGAASNIDRIIIGKATGSSELGAYEKAKQLMLLPTQLVSGILTKTMLPTLSLLQSKPERYARSYLRLFAAVCFVSYPMVFGMNFVADDLIPYIFGSQWTSMVPIFKILSWAGLFTILNILSDNVLISSGNRKGLMRLTFIEKPFLIALLFVGIIFGVTGVALAYTFGSAAVFLYKSYVSSKPLHYSWSELLRRLLMPLLCSVLMYLTLSIITPQLSEISIMTRLITTITSGTVIYMTLSLFLQRDSIEFFKKAFAEFGRKDTGQ